MTEYRLAARALQENQRSACARGGPASGIVYGLILMAPFFAAAVLVIVVAVRS